MGFCISKQTYDIEKFENTNIKRFEGSYINEKKNGYCIEFSIEGKKIYEGQFLNNLKTGLVNYTMIKKN